MINDSGINNNNILSGVGCYNEMNHTHTHTIIPRVYLHLTQLLYTRLHFLDVADDYRASRHIGARRIERYSQNSTIGNQLLGQIYLTQSRLNCKELA